MDSKVQTDNLLREIETANVPAGTVALWWLGQEGWVIRGGDATLVIDAFITDYGNYGRAYPSPLDPTAFGSADLVIGTHNHVDHIDPLGFPQLMTASGSARGVVPAQVLEAVVEMDVAPERLTGMIVGQVLEHKAVRLTAIPAVHSDDPNRDGYGLFIDDQGRHRYLGYVIEIDGVRIAHLGDTMVYDGLVETVRNLDLDLLMLPINGQGYFRHGHGIAGNMNAFDAAHLVEESGAQLAVPMHWDLFTGNGEDPGHFVSHALRFHNAVPILIPVVGRRINLVARGDQP
ncbi:MAG: MBL fold metallo-hydrolase [Candidatus Dormibacteria bacterium]